MTEVSIKELYKLGIPDHPYGVLHDMTNEELDKLPYGGVGKLIEERVSNLFVTRKGAAKVLGISLYLMDKRRDAFPWARDGRRVLMIRKYLACPESNQ